MMAELEEHEHGATGAVREWLARASRARRDPVWMADGIVYDAWAPASPITGKLDAFVWRAPEERLSAPIENPAIPASPHRDRKQPAIVAPCSSRRQPRSRSSTRTRTRQSAAASNRPARSTFHGGKPAAWPAARLAVARSPSRPTIPDTPR